MLQEDDTAASLQQLPHLGDDQFKQQYLNLKSTNTLMLMMQQMDESQALRVVRLALEVDMMLGAKLAGSVKPQFQARTLDLVATLDVDEQLTIQLLGMTGSDNAIPSLLQALDYGDFHLRELAAAALGQIGSDVAVSGLLQALQDEYSQVRQSAAAALGQIGSDAAVTGLLQALQDEDSYVRWRAAYAFGQIDR